MTPLSVALLVAAAVPLRHVLAAIVARPQRGVLLLLALVPFDGLLLLLPVPSVVASWKLALLLAVVVASLLPGPERVAVRWRAVPTWLWPVFGLVVLGALSAVSVGGTTGLVGLRVEFAYVLVLVPLLRTPLTARDRDHLVTVLMVTGLLVAAVGLLQQLVGPARLHDLGYPYNDVIRTAAGRLRSFSTFNQPFPYAFWLMSVLCVAGPVAAQDRRRLRNRVFLLAAPLLLLGLVAAIVRGAILGLVVAAVLLAWHRRTALGRPLVGLGIVLALVPADVYGTLLSSASLGDRTTSWSDNIGRLLAEPFGHGIGSSGSAAEKLAGGAAVARGVFQPDNAYYNVMYQLGPVGLWLLVHVVVALVVAGLLASRSQADERDAALALGTALCGVAVGAAGLVANYFEIFPVQLLFWTMAGVLATLPGRPAAVGAQQRGLSSPRA